MDETRKHIYISHALYLMFQIETGTETRQAETDNDFQIIFEKEFKNHIAKDREQFRELHIYEIQQEAATLENFDRSAFYQIVEKVNLYIQFLRREPGAQTPATIKSKGLSMAEIALICIYTNQHIDSKNASQILTKFNPSFKSGRSLIQKYNNLHTPGNRIYLSDNKITDKNRERLLFNVVSYLETNELETTKAKKELQNLSEQIISRY